MTAVSNLTEDLPLSEEMVVRNMRIINELEHRSTQMQRERKKTVESVV
jgi:hypothetical protein